MNLSTKIKYIKLLNNSALIEEKKRELQKLHKRTKKEKYLTAYTILDNIYIRHKPEKHTEKFLGIYHSSFYTEDAKTMTLTANTFLFLDLNLQELNFHEIFPNMRYNIRKSNFGRSIKFVDDYDCFQINVLINRFSYITIVAHFDKLSFPFRGEGLFPEIGDIFFEEDILDSVFGFFKKNFYIDENYWREKDVIYNE